MEREYLEELRDNVTDLKEIIDNNFAEIKELEQEESVQRYIRLIELRSKMEHGLTMRSEDDLIQYEVNRFDRSKIYETNNIWFYLGVCSSTQCFKLFRTRTKIRGEVAVFADIENEKILHFCKPNEVEEFMSLNKVINTGREFDWVSYKKIKNAFFITAVKESQEDACNVVTRVRSNK